MERSRSKTDIIGILQRRIAGIESQLKTLRNQNLALPDWIAIGSLGAPAYQNGWVDNAIVSPSGNVYPGARFWKDSSGMVHVSGMVKSGANGATIFTLPVGFRPSTPLFLGSIYSGGTLGVYINDVTGEVVPFGITGSVTGAGYVNIECSFRAEQ